MYIRFLEPRINQSDATLLCDVTNKMQLYDETYTLMVQDRHSYCTATAVLAVIVFLFDKVREKGAGPLTK